MEIWVNTNDGPSDMHTELEETNTERIGEQWLWKGCTDEGVWNRPKKLSRDAYGMGWGRRIERQVPNFWRNWQNSYVSDQKKIKRHWGWRWVRAHPVRNTHYPQGNRKPLQNLKGWGGLESVDGVGWPGHTCSLSTERRMDWKGSRMATRKWHGLEAVGLWGHSGRQSQKIVKEMNWLPLGMKCGWWGRENDISVCLECFCLVSLWSRLLIKV